MKRRHHVGNGNGGNGNAVAVKPAISSEPAGVAAMQRKENENGK